MKNHAPATLRNREPIAEVLAEELPASGTVLEVAAGTGEHAAYFAQRFASLEWLPTDPEPAALASIAEWRAEANADNLAEPVMLDAASDTWPAARADAVVCINMIHISTRAANEGLFRQAGHLLSPGAPLILYGPYFEDGVETAPSNLSFDESLRARHPEWGLRDTAEIDRLASASGLERSRRIAMPANNIMLVFRRR